MLIYASTGALSVIALFWGLINLISKNKVNVSKDTRLFLQGLKDTTEKYASSNKTVLKAEELGVRLTGANYVFIVSTAILAGIICAAVFKNWYFIIIGIIIGYMIPENLIELAKAKKQKEYLFSSISSVEMIAIENMGAPNIITSMIRALPHMKEPFKGEMAEVIRSVNSGKYTLSEALDQMVVRTKSKHLKKVANSMKFADSIGGQGTKILQQDANLLYQDKLIFEKAEARLKKERSESIKMSILQLAPFLIMRISLTDLYQYIMDVNILPNIKLGPLVLFLVLLKIIFDLRYVIKKSRFIV